MSTNRPLEDALARLGQSSANQPPDGGRKRDIKAQLFARDPPGPRRLGRFVDLGLLGRGAMGTVRRAYDDKLDRNVAIKVLRRRPTPRDNDRLLREAQALARLSHPNVVQIYEVGELEHEIFIAMELCDGITLDQWQLSRPSWRACVDAYLQAGRGLAAAHAAGLVHRDFKPSNCMRDEAGRVRVLDFGLARAIHPTDRTQTQSIDELRAPSVSPPPGGAARATGEGGSLLPVPLTEKGSLVGTIAYMAPEQFGHRRADARSDQFSFCVALFEAIHGRSPFGGDPRAVLRQMAAGVDPPLAEAAAGAVADSAVPASLQRALRRGLSARPQARWPSMDALLRQLERARRGWSGRWWWLVTLAAGVATGVGLATANQADEDPCLQTRESLDGAWDDERRGAVHDALVATGAPYARAAWTTVRGELDAYASEWEDAERATCRAEHRHPEQSARWSAQRRCLWRRRASLAHEVELLARADVALAARAVELVLALPAVGECVDEPGQPSPDPSQRAAQVDPAVDPDRADALLVALDRARTLDAAGRYDEGLLAAAEAVAVADAIGDESGLAQARLVEGTLLMNAGRHPEAEARLADALERALRHGPDELVVDVLAMQGHVVGVERARSEAGLWSATFAVELAQRPHVRTRPRVHALTSLGHVRIVRGELAQAQAPLERALTIEQDAHGRDHLALARILDSLAQVFRRQGQLPQAMAYRMRVLELRRRWLGEQHPDTAHAMSNIAAVLYDQGELLQARRRLERALEIQRAALGPEHQTVAHTRNNLAAILVEQGQYAEAERQWREAMEIWERTRGATHPDVARVRINIADALVHAKRVSEATEQYEAALRILAHGERSPDNVRLWAQALRDLGRLHAGQDRLDEAEARYQRALAVLGQHGEADDPMAASVLNQLGALALRQGAGEQAVARHQDALAIYTASVGPQHRRVADTLRHLARALAEQGQWERAEDTIERALAIYATPPGRPGPERVAEAEQIRDEIVRRRARSDR